MDPLNPTLYSALERAFGDVIVANPGQPLRIRVGRAAESIRGEKSRRKKVDTIDGGEYYRVNCPVCRESRNRLWINHAWDTVQQGVRLRHFAVCYNEHCEQRKGFTDELRKYVRGYKGYTADVKRGSTRKAKADEITLPGLCTPFHEMPDDHPAVAYMTSRGFNKSSSLARCGAYCGVRTVVFCPRRTGSCFQYTVSTRRARLSCRVRSPGTSI